MSDQVIDIVRGGVYSGLVDGHLKVYTVEWLSEDNEDLVAYTVWNEYDDPDMIKRDEFIRILNEREFKYIGLCFWRQCEISYENA